VHGRPSGTARSLPYTGREFLSDKVYRRDDRRIVGVEPFGPHSLGFFSVHTILDVRPGLTVPACLGDRRNKKR
jgi:hypothetical protein